MELHTPFVALVNHKLHRVPIGVGCLALHTGEETAPRLQAGGIECIGFGTDLEEDGIDACSLQRVELLNQRLLQLFGRYTLKLTVDSLYPSSTEFAFGVTGSGDLCLHTGGQHEESTTEQK